MAKKRTKQDQSLQALIREVARAQVALHLRRVDRVPANAKAQSTAKGRSARPTKKGTATAPPSSRSATRRRERAGAQQRSEGTERPPVDAAAEALRVHQSVADDALHGAAEDAERKMRDAAEARRLAEAEEAARPLCTRCNRRKAEPGTQRCGPCNVFVARFLGAVPN